MSYKKQFKLFYIMLNIGRGLCHIRVEIACLRA